MLYGRENLIVEIVDGARRGHMVGAIEGVTGIGKSALLSEAAVRLTRSGFDGIATVNAAQSTTEALALAAIYPQLKTLARDPTALARRIKEQLSTNMVAKLRKIGVAVAADLVAHLTEHAENTTDAIKEILSGEEDTTSVSEHLEELSQENLRFFTSELLKAVIDVGNRVVIAIDNLDSAEPSLIAFVRFLVAQKPDGVALLLAFNTETGDIKSWDAVVADVRARGGKRHDVQPLGPADTTIWFSEKIGRQPTDAELRKLLTDTHGRAEGIRVAVDWIRDRGEPPPQPDYAGYYEQSRQQLSTDAYMVAELLAVVHRDALAPEAALAKAAKALGVSNLGRGLEELRVARLLKTAETNHSLVHSLAQESWIQAIPATRRRELESAWFNALKDFQPNQLASPDLTGLLPIIANNLASHRSVEDVARFGEALIDKGQIRYGLDLLDRTWKYVDGEGVMRGGAPMRNHALTAARVRIDLGRYREADEPLAQAEQLAGGDENAQTEVLLLRMKLALRLNNYAALPILADRVYSRAIENTSAQIETELTLNTASRDLLDFSGLEESVATLQRLRGVADFEQRNAIDRALARSLAKLGEADAALECAESAVASTDALNSIRAIGNAKLALGEVLRYRGDYASAIAAYREAAAIGRASGNRDSQIWSLLGEAAAEIQIGSDQMPRALADVDALLAEPGYDHPLESAHSALLHALSDWSDEAKKKALALYDALRIEWPTKFLADFQHSRMLQQPIPL